MANHRDNGVGHKGSGYCVKGLAYLDSWDLRSVLALRSLLPPSTRGLAEESAVGDAISCLFGAPL